MPIPLRYPIVNSLKEICLKTNLLGNETEWMAWWYCGIYKNSTESSQPHVLVAFRELASGELSDDTIFRRVPLTTLGQIRVGTIWKRARSRSEVAFKRASFFVDFDKDGWSISSFNNSFHNPYPLDIYPLAYKRDKNWLIEFLLPDGGKLVIPCLEFFSRCYGRSEEIKRILATYPWQGRVDSVVERFFAPIGEPEEPDKWKVKLKKRLVNGDVVFLAHAKYDDLTQQAAQSIYSQIESQYTPESNSPLFTKVSPWFHGIAQLIVKGIPFDNGKSFLGLRILGCSDPDGVDIDRSRENCNKTDQPADNNLGLSWAGRPERVLVRAPEIVDLTGDEAPDYGSAPIEVQDPDFIVPGKPRVVRDVRKAKADSSSGLKNPGDAVDIFSSGDYRGDGKHIGYASLHSKPVMESQGVLRDVWNAVQFLARSHRNSITSVNWFTIESGFCSDPEPKLIGLEPFAASEDVSVTTRKWVYISTADRLPRGVLLIKITVDDVNVYILEVQRRKVTNRQGSNEQVIKEENYKGLVFTLDNNELLLPWLRYFMSQIRHARGIVQRITGMCPGMVAAFNHTPASSDRVPCESTIINALGKMSHKLIR